ncbi:MAG: UPF0280 family protein [Nitrososphaerota archaeon]|jgi:ApbE superfamily uncharacterized protein (UPF0280 family)|nr:UPF0280 family protein [Nitrososphaerota archaeon]
MYIGKNNLPSDLFKEDYTYKDSVCHIISDIPQGITAAKESIARNYQGLENYIRTHQIFFHTYDPIPVPNEPLVAKLMALAAQKTGVGPMAAVAGVIADLAVTDMQKVGCKVAVVEDGGEISAVSDRPIDVALAAGSVSLSKRFGFRLLEFPVGVATSSGRFSHAFSFGDAEAATVFCRDAGLADAAATAVGNVVKGDVEEGIEAGIKQGLSISGVLGVFILYQGKVGTAGKIPQIIKVKV